MKRLYTRIYLHLLGAVVVVALVTSVVFAHGWRSAMMHAWALRFTSYVADTVGEHCDDAVERHRILARAADGLDLDLTLRAPDGRLLDHWGPSLPFVTADELPEGPQFLLRKDRPFWGTVVRNPAGRVCAVAESIGRRPVHPPPLWRPLVTVLLVLLLVAAGAIPLARRISRPIEALTDGSRRLAQGDLGYRIPLGGSAASTGSPDQLGELTLAWNDMAERVDHLVRGQRALLANVSHEFRSPLTRIRMALALLGDGPHPNGGDGNSGGGGLQAQRIAGIEADLGELDSLIETLLTASRLEESGLPSQLASLSVPRLLDELEARSRRSPLLADETLIVTRPEHDAGHALLGDERLLSRLLTNLVENAAKYGRSPLSVTAEHVDERWRIVVSDEGPGIPRAERERVFEPFARLPTAAATDGTEANDELPRGFGLGLTLARRIAEVHGGTITVSATHPDADPAKESGCTMTVDLPDEKIG